MRIFGAVPAVPRSKEIRANKGVWGGSDGGKSGSNVSEPAQKPSAPLGRKIPAVNCEKIAERDSGFGALGEIRAVSVRNSESGRAFPIGAPNLGQKPPLRSSSSVEGSFPRLRANLGQEKTFIYLFILPTSLPSPPPNSAHSPNRAGAVGQRQRPTHIPTKTAPEIEHENEIKCFPHRKKNIIYIFIYPPEKGKEGILHEARIGPPVSPH